MIKLTPAAHQHIKKVLTQERAGYFKLSLSQKGCTGFAYVMSAAKSIEPGWVAQQCEDVTVAMPESDVDRLSGSLLDWVRDGLGARIEDVGRWLHDLIQKHHGAASIGLQAFDDLFSGDGGGDLIAKFLDLGILFFKRRDILFKNFITRTLRGDLQCKESMDDRHRRKASAQGDSKKGQVADFDRFFSFFAVGEQIDFWIAHRELPA